MTEFVDGDGFVIVAIDWEAEEIFFAEAGGFAACAADTFVLVGWVGVIAIFGHVGVNFVSANDD